MASRVTEDLVRACGIVDEPYVQSTAECVECFAKAIFDAWTAATSIYVFIKKEADKGAEAR